MEKGKRMTEEYEDKILSEDYIVDTIIKYRKGLLGEDDDSLSTSKSSNSNNNLFECKMSVQEVVERIRKLREDDGK